MSYFLASSIGLTLLLKYAKIIKHYRQQITSKDEFFQDLFKCSLCLGFWSGALHIPFAALCQGPQLEFLMLPLISAGASWFTDSALQMIQALELYLMKQVRKD